MDGGRSHGCPTVSHGVPWNAHVWRPAGELGRRGLTRWCVAGSGEGKREAGAGMAADWRRRGRFWGF